MDTVRILFQRHDRPGIILPKPGNKGLGNKSRFLKKIGILDFEGEVR
jgi:hypothetical protein